MDRMNLESLTEDQILESNEMNLSKDNIILPKASLLKLVKNPAKYFQIFLGNQIIYSTGEESSARDYYKLVKSAIENNNYKIIIHSTFDIDIDH